ncbi:UNVERIFIED_CONTAM: hypothetical protein GTU68_058642 [Idotea baltica]|nr:hypothetical protein [Idotea baltica]
MPPEKQTAKLSVEKRKRGKVVTVIAGLSPENTDLNALLKDLKNHVGAGGSVADTSLEIQGRQLERVRDKLKTMGYRVKG